MLGLFSYATLSFIILLGKGVCSDIHCKSDEFSCPSLQCINKNMWCDGKMDCDDGFDERFCQISDDFDEEIDPNHCSSNNNFFLCNDGICIPSTGRCDGLNTCKDGSDELNCTISKEMNNTEFTITHKIKKREQVDDLKSYTDLNYNDYKYNLESARNWLISQQNEDYGWGDSTPRAVIAMYLSKTDNYHKDELYALMDKQLDIYISIALTGNQTREISLSELALYINALRAACSNPRNFYGYDLVQILRERVDSINHSQKLDLVRPYVYWTLCLNNSTRYHDYHSLQNLVRSKESMSDKIDILALSVLASSCMIKVPEFAHNQFRKSIVAKLVNKIKVTGLPGNVYELALLIQALNEVKRNPEEWYRTDAMEFLLNKQNENGSFGDMLATYYAIPILSGYSISKLPGHCSNNYSHELIPLAVLRNSQETKITVAFSLFFGDPIQISQRIQLSVAEGTIFLNVMRLAQEENSNFRFKLDGSQDFPFVYSIGGIPNDAERGLYWTLYIASFNSSNRIKYNKDIRRYIPKNNEEMIFWFKPM